MKFPIRTNKDFNRSYFNRTNLFTFFTLLLSLFSFGYYFRSFTFNVSVLDWDEITYFIMGKGILLGQIPYVDLWDIKPIGIYLIHAISLFVLPYDPVTLRWTSFLHLIALTMVIVSFHKEKNWFWKLLSGLLVLYFLSGFVGGFAIFLRSESLFYIGIPYVYLILNNRSNIMGFIKKHFFILFGFGFSFILFGLYNYIEFQEFFGIRSRVSYNDFFRIDFSHRLRLIWQYFFGDENRVGFVFYCFPIIILLLLSLFKFEWNRIQRFLFYSSLISFVLIVLFSPYSSGGLYLGMRFTEFSYILFCIFLISFLGTSQKNSWSYLLIGLLFLQLLLGVFHVRRNFKTIDYVKKYHEIFQGKLEEHANAPVIHLSTFDLLLVSDSFLKKPHYITHNLKEFHALESKLFQSGVKQIQIFYYDFKPPQDLNSSNEFYQEWIDTKFEIQSNYYQIKSDETIAGFKLLLWTAK
ncbi:hypothetical protein [Leptospira jelokensis]|uniref:hypothetical protein n=1 Tax=Leptospira jelokensis TaxID=2484931 RepID=UPI001ABFBD79|nr:hypothetical protein [Leptospira jelokensis]